MEVADADVHHASSWLTRSQQVLRQRLPQSTRTGDGHLRTKSADERARRRHRNERADARITPTRISPAAGGTAEVLRRNTGRRQDSRGDGRSMTVAAAMSSSARPCGRVDSHLLPDAR